MPASATKAVDFPPLWHIMQVEGRGETELARIAALQHGVVTREQLLAAGFGRGDRPSRGERAALPPPSRGVSRRRRHAGAAVGRDGRGAAVQGLRDPQPPARTLLDLAADAEEHELLRALAQARFKHMVTDAELDATIVRAQNRKGAGRLRSLMVSGDGDTESGTERRMFSLLRAAGLPLPVPQVPLHGYRVDFLWPARKLVLEVDSYEFHGDRATFESDRERDQVLMAAGYRVIRITYRQLRDEPLAVIARLSGALSRAHE